MSLFAYDMILDTENSKDVTRRLLELISELGTVLGYRADIQRSLTLLYTSKRN